MSMRCCIIPAAVQRTTCRARATPKFWKPRSPLCTRACLRKWRSHYALPALPTCELHPAPRKPQCSVSSMGRTADIASGGQLRYFLPRAGESQERRMAEKRKAPADSSQRKRAPTIDLTATEVPNEAQSAAAPPTPEPSPESTSAASPADAPSAPEPVQGPAAALAGPPSEPPPEEPSPAAEPAAEEAPPAPPPARPHAGGLLAGLAIALVVALWVLAGLWYAGVLPGPGAQQADQLSRLETQVAGLQKESGDLKSRLEAV